MTSRIFPSIDIDMIAETRDALHAYVRVPGDCLKSSRPKRKHWWHASLRPSLTGLTTGVIHADIDFEIELDFRSSKMHLRTATGEVHSELLKGQPMYQLMDVIRDFLRATGIKRDLSDHDYPDPENTRQFDKYSEEQANLIGRVFSSVAATMRRFRAEISEESSPVQIWPHHFDLSMLWLPGEKVPDQDPKNEEYADKQMNFGFVFGDDSIPEPYFYVTAYPLPEALSQVALPAGTNWQSIPFQGAVLRYESLTGIDEPDIYLLELWRVLLNAGRTHMLDQVA